MSQMSVMLSLQDNTNQLVEDNWQHANFAWHRAVWMECAEMLEHYGWKWWKHQQADTEQVALELVDIFHFGLSMALLEKIDGNQLQQELQQGIEQPLDQDFPETLEKIVLEVLQHNTFNMYLFGSLMAKVAMPFDDLFRCYVGKNVLNNFRQDNGYKQGTYQKQWQGREDNIHLAEIMRDISPTTQDFMNILYKKLEQRYSQCVC